MIYKMRLQNKRRLALVLRRRFDAYQALASLLTLLLFSSLVSAVSFRQAFGGSFGLFQQTPQQSRDKASGGGDEKDVRELEAGKSIKGELAGGRRHAYRISLGADQFLKVVIEQQGIDVVAQVSGPDGKQILELDSESRLQGREEVSLVAEAAGAFQLIVRPKQNGAPAGSYEIRIEELRVATDTDRALHDARKQFEEALKLQRAGKYDEALSLVERALEIRERLLGPEHREVAAGIDSLAGVYSDRGEYVKAEPLYLRALAIREKALGNDHPDTATGASNLGKLYHYQGKYGDADPLYQRALEIREKALGNDHPDTAEGINNLAVLYSALGKYVEAEPLHQRALDIREKALGKDHPFTAQSLNNLAFVYEYLGKYEEAEPLYKRALDIREKALGKDHPSTAISLNSLASLYHLQGKYAEAEPLYRRSLDIREKALGKDHPSTATGISNLARIYDSQGKYAEAEPLYKRALDIYEKSLGNDHPLTANSLNNLGTHYRRQGKYEEAEPLYKRALDIREKSLGIDHPGTVIDLNSLSALYMAKGDFVQAVKFQSRANAGSERDLVANLAIGPERQKLAYLALLSVETDRTISLHLHSASDDPAPGALAATMILQRKGRALDATSQNLNALRSRFNAEDQALLDLLTETRSQIARLVLSGPQNMTIEQHRDLIKALKDQADKDEADISRRSDEFRAQFLPVTLEAVRAAIPPDSALIEFASYRPFNAKAKKGDEAYGQPRYVAYVLRHEGEVKWKELGDAKSIDTAIAALRKTLRDPRRGDVKRPARAVDAKVFQPVRPLLGDVTRLLISPDGLLNLIPFAALVNERGRYVVERYSISYLASGRDLLRLQVARESKGGPLVVAAPDFGGGVQAKASRLKSQQKYTLAGEVKAESARTAVKELYFPPLPDAAKEGEALRSLLSGATLLTKRQATKTALSQMRGPRLLHIATHGFFLEDQNLTSAGGRGVQAITDDPERALQQLERRGGRIESPLLRSGLALAGANEQKDDDNGILTALEVTGLNLWGTKLVTLSACDTGVGEVKNGDGVHGLRRALVLAGEETQVMSRWAVPDQATRELMVSYYRKMQRGQGRGDALRRAQLEMLKKAQWRHPYFWAGFIQSGEWANLEGKR